MRSQNTDAAVHFEKALALDVPAHWTENRLQQLRSSCYAGIAAALMLHRSQIAWQLKDNSRAISLLAEVVKKLPELTAAWDLMALILIESEQEKERQNAFAITRKNFERNPRSSKALATLGWVTYKLRDAEQAAKMLRAASEQDGHPQTVYFAAVVLHERGQLKDVDVLVRRLKHELTQPHVFPLRAEAQKWLSELQENP